MKLEGIGFLLNVPTQVTIFQVHFWNFQVHLVSYFQPELSKCSEFFKFQKKLSNLNENLKLSNFSVFPTALSNSYHVSFATEIQSEYILGRLNALFWMNFSEIALSHTPNLNKTEQVKFWLDEFFINRSSSCPEICQ